MFISRLKSMSSLPVSRTARKIISFIIALVRIEKSNYQREHFENFMEDFSKQQQILGKRNTAITGFNLISEF